MSIHNKFKIFCASFCFLINIIFNCESTGLNINNEPLDVYKTERILEFIYWKTSLNKPITTEKNLENYLSEIMRLLENKEVFNVITKLLVEDADLPLKAGLTQDERGILLALCLYKHSESTGVYWDTVREEIGTFPYMNLFFDSDEYAAYQMDKNKIFFVQLTGRGAHNNSYLLWNIKIEEGKFKPILLDVPEYNEESKSISLNSKINAKNVDYDSFSDEKDITITVNSSDFNTWKMEENIYQMKDDKLTHKASCILKKDCKTLIPNNNKTQ